MSAARFGAPVTRLIARDEVDVNDGALIPSVEVKAVVLSVRRRTPFVANPISSAVAV